jgi:hypothetical protein
MWLFRHCGGLTGAVLPPVRRIAQEVVWEIAREGLPLRDEEKHRTAFFRIQRRAIDAQVPWAPHVINLAIELAVADLKRHRKRLEQIAPPSQQDESPGQHLSAPGVGDNLDALKAGRAARSLRRWR